MDEPAGWVADLQRAAATIAGVEIAHPGNHQLKTAAKPFLDYVRGLGTPEPTED